MIALRRLSAVTLVLTYGLIVLGAWVRATNSGLSCPDWPTCYGHMVPLPADIPADAGYTYFQVMLEWVHRLIAGVFLGPLILVLAWLTWRVRSELPQMPVYGGALVVLLLVQGALGGVTVLDRNSPWSVALHLGTALILFTTLWLIHIRARGPRRGASSPLQGVAILSWFLAFGTMVSAAVMTKSGASLGCASWPLCNATIVPDLSDPYVRLGVLHRLFALGFVLVLALWAWAGRDGAVRLALVFTLGEVVLGAVVVWLEVAIWSGVLHQAVGVLTFATVTLALWRAIPARYAGEGRGRSCGETEGGVGLSRA